MQSNSKSDDAKYKPSSRLPVGYPISPLGMPYPYHIVGYPTAMPPYPLQPAWATLPVQESSEQNSSAVMSAPLAVTSSSQFLPDEYTVDTMRRTYNKDDGSIEIERVKFQRKQPFGSNQYSDLRILSQINKPESSSTNLLPFASPVLNERRPPPRKKRKKVQDLAAPSSSLISPQGSYPCHPYMWYMPYPYPYYCGYTWPPPSHEQMSAWKPTRSSNSPIAFDTHLQTPSPTPEVSKTHIIQTHSNISETSPIDNTSVDRELGSPSDELSISIPLTCWSDTSISEIHSVDPENTKEWLDIIQSVAKIKDNSSDSSSFVTAELGVHPVPAKRNSLKKKEKIIKAKNAAENDTKEKDLAYALWKLEKSVDAFKEKIASDISITEDSGKNDEHSSSASTSSFHSTRLSVDDIPCATESTELLVSSEIPLLYENDSNMDSAIALWESKCSWKWVLQQPGEMSKLIGLVRGSDPNNENDIQTAWRAEVSLWRARLVVSLCRGLELDQQDWSTFHLMVHHPLSVSFKVSLLHPYRLCLANSNVGAGLLRLALMFLSQIGNILLQPKENRPPGWKTIVIDSHQPWAPVKGVANILRVMGYHKKENNVLKYSRRLVPETSILARLTLDLLVLSEELRLYLTGTHSHPSHITDMFCCSVSSPNSPSPTVHTPACASYEFLSAATSSASLNDKSISRNSSEDEEKTENLESSQFVSNLSFRNDEHSSLHVNSDFNSASMPDLQSFSTEAQTDKDQSADSQGSVTPVPSPTPLDDSEKSRATEDHIYEEIGDARTQSKAPETREKTKSPDPPPLPPKVKINLSVNQECETNTHSESLLSLRRSSQSSSVCSGSTSSKKKKRRAPLPPEFVKDVDIFSIQVPLNPFYEKGNKKSEKELNPFYNEETKPTGYVGKNPFYDDVETVKSSVQNIQNKLVDNDLLLPDENTVVCSNEIMEKDQNVKNIIDERPAIPNIKEIKEEIMPNTKNCKVENQEVDRKSIDETNKTDDSVTGNYETKNEVVDEKCSDITNKAQNESVACKHRAEEQAVDEKSSSNKTKKAQDENVPLKNSNEIFSKNDENQPLKSECSSSDESQITECFVSISQIEAKVIHKKGGTINIGEPINIMEKSDNIKNEVEEKLVVSLKSVQKDVTDITSSEPQKDVNTNQDTKICHNSTPEKPTSIVPGVTQASPVTLSPVLPQKSFRILDDIPYIDTNEVKIYKNNCSVAEEPTASHYEIPEEPKESDIALQAVVPPSKYRHTASLLQGHHSVPFIDEADLPPDRPPPPPPIEMVSQVFPSELPSSTFDSFTSPSLPDTPHCSPPETPPLVLGEAGLLQEERYEIPQLPKDLRIINMKEARILQLSRIRPASAPPRPPRRKKVGSSPPPRPPKTFSQGSAPPSLMTSRKNSKTVASPPPLLRKAFTKRTAQSENSVGKELSSPSHSRQKACKTNSWPSLLCSCMHSNYEDSQKSNLS